MSRVSKRIPITALAPRRRATRAISVTASSRALARLLVDPRVGLTGQFLDPGRVRVAGQGGDAADLADRDGHRKARYVLCCNDQHGVVPPAPHGRTLSRYRA